MTATDEDEWWRPIDPMADSHAPDEIASELGRRHSLYLREAQRLVLDGLVPDEPGLADGIRRETRRYLRSHPWLAHAALAEAVAETERSTIAALHAIVASALTAADAHAPGPVRPVRRLTLQPSRRSSATWQSARCRPRKASSSRGTTLRPWPRGSSASASGPIHAGSTSKAIS